MTDGRGEVARRILRLRGVERDLQEELGFHVAETVEELMAGGMSREDAEREARRRFGDERRYRARLASIDRAAERRRRWTARLDALGEACRFAVRGLRRSPGLSMGIVLAFALGIGANATMFGAVDRLLLRPPSGIHDPDRVARLWAERHSPFRIVAGPDQGEGRRPFSSFTYPDYRDLVAASSFSSIAAYGTARLTLGHGVDAREIDARMATASFWEVLGARPALGRFYTAAEDVRGAEPVAVISYGLWQREFGSDPGVVGRELDLGHARYTVIGVAPQGFTGAELTPVDVWLPLHVAATLRFGSDRFTGSRTWWWISIVARLRPGVPAEAAATEATALHRAGRRELFEKGSERPDPTILPASLIAARGPSPAPEIAVSRWLAGVSLVVLLIACANVANLLIARAIRHQRETAIRLALGISRRRLVGQMLAEGALLALLGAVAALIVTHWSGAFVQRTLLPDVAWGAPVNRLVVAFVLALTLGAGLLSALIPALQATRRGVAGALRESSGGINLSATRLRSWLSGLQVALSVVLLVGAGLLVRSLHNVRSIDLGFDAEHVLFARPSFAPGGVGDAERALVLARAAENLSRLAAVERVAVAEIIPFSGGMVTSFRAEGVDSIRSVPSGGPYIYKVGPGFFDVLGLDIRRGREFEETDRKGAPQVAVLNESLAAHLWPGQDPLGRCLYVGEDATACTRVVGVVEDSHRQGIREPEQLIYYVPIAQQIAMEVSGTETFVLRTRRDPESLADAVRRTIVATDARVRFVESRPLQELIDPQLRSWKLGATMFTIFGALALVVAMIGLYAVLSFDVAQRTREIGLRSALGASPPSIVRIFLARAIRLTVYGTAVGLVAALALAPRIEALLFDTSPRDPATLGAVTLALLLVAAAAATVPAWRAARVDPNIALRAD
jgi:predicted permease